uniref:Polyribonucleotide nucleotidyltransferase n=2 Tax=Tetraselmis sp. GSL018 TaxID=582737 RepID=A0A061RT32_9CHLO
MASVCGACLAMMDAGVPVKAMVAGVAMGLVLKDDGSFVVLTDILGTEDALGDMDFKVAGSREGVTAFQMDIKVEGITIDIMKQALEQARRGRLHILDRMGECRPYPAGEVRPFVPRVKRIEVPVDDIALIIGSKGATIKALIEESGAESINVSQDGTVEILAPSSESVEKAVELIKQRTTRIQAGQIYRKCKVVSCVAFGCFIEIMPGKEGLCHISELDLKRVNAVEDVVKRGDLVDVKVLAVASNGKISLSRKAVLADQSPEVTLAEEAGAKN